MWITDSLEKTLMLREIEGGMRSGRQRIRWFEWYHQLNGHEFESASGVSDGQGSLVYCSPWGHKESDTTERLKWTEQRCMGFSFFPFLTPNVSGSSDNYLIRPPIWPLHTPTPNKIYLQQTPAVPSQIDVITRVEASSRYGTLQLRSDRERLLLSETGLCPCELGRSCRQKTPPPQFPRSILHIKTLRRCC